MSDIIAPLSLAISVVLSTAMICGAGLAAWRGWLELKKLQLQGVPRGRAAVPPLAEQAEEADMAVVIELAAVKDRLRRLEAIASGVEL